MTLNSDCNHVTVAAKPKAWVGDFCLLYQTKHVTPYVHAMAMHVPQFIELYGNITKFTEQGLEKLNDLTLLYQNGTAIMYIMSNYSSENLLRKLALCYSDILAFSLCKCADCMNGYNSV